MRLLFVTDRLSLRGGADQHLGQVIAAAVERGDDVTIACARRDAGAAPPASAEVVSVRALGAAVASARGLERLAPHLARADVVHVQNVMNPTALTLVVATGRAVVTVQDHRLFCPAIGRTLPDGSRCTEPMSDTQCTECLPDADYRARTLALTAARRDAVAAAARVLVLSHYMAEELAAAGVTPVEVLPPWVAVAPADPDDPGHGWLLAGRLVAHKGVTDAVAAWGLAGGGEGLRVAGEGPLAGELAAAERLGWLSADGLRAELVRARGLLFPARWQEPFGIVGVEALAVGRPVIVADVGGTADWSDAGCIRVPAGSPRAMADAIDRLRSSPEAARRLGAEGRGMVAERFARGRIASRLRELYAEVATAAGARGG